MTGSFLLSHPSKKLGRTRFAFGSAPSALAGRELQRAVGSAARGDSFNKPSTLFSRTRRDSPDVSHATPPSSSLNPTPRKAVSTSIEDARQECRGGGENWHEPRRHSSRRIAWERSLQLNRQRRAG
jgi:hypothetical protein